MKGFYILYTFLLFTASAASGAPGRVSDTIINQSLNLSFNKTDHRHLEKATEDIVEGRIFLRN